MSQKDYDMVINTLGSDATYFTIKPASAGVSMRVGFSTMTNQDSTVVNSFATGDKMITIKASAVTTAPIKFDYVLIKGEKFVFDTVNTVHAGGGDKVLGYRCLVKGKQ